MLPVEHPSQLSGVLKWRDRCFHIRVYVLFAFARRRWLTRVAKHRVDKYIIDLDLPAVFVLTGTFYDNLIFRKHIVYLEELDKIEFRHPVIQPHTKRKYVHRRLTTIDDLQYSWCGSRETCLLSPEPYTTITRADDRSSNTNTTLCPEDESLTMT